MKCMQVATTEQNEQRTPIDDERADVGIQRNHGCDLRCLRLGKGNSNQIVRAAGTGDEPHHGAIGMQLLQIREIYRVEETKKGSALLDPVNLETVFLAQDHEGPGREGTLFGGNLGGKTGLIGGHAIRGIEAIELDLVGIDDRNAIVLDGKRVDAGSRA